MEPDQKYPAAEAEHIANLLSRPTEAACILLFGSLAGGTPHSDIAAYDLLIITEAEPRYDTEALQRLLKLKMPPSHRRIGYINTLAYSQQFITGHPSPVFYFAKSEGTALYCAPHFRPARPSIFNFDTAFRTASRCFDTSFALGGNILDDARSAVAANDPTRAALYSAQAAVLFLRTLFCVYHGFETECDDPALLYGRLRTLSGELMVLSDSDHYRAVNTIPRLRNYLRESPDRAACGISAGTVAADTEYVGRMYEIAGELCRRRIALYETKRKKA